ncbi:hypothetical protein [Syntrophus gentianae]|nr:hypothetical protein [Syntrophus gentianae]
MARNQVAASTGFGWRNETESGGVFKRNRVAEWPGIRIFKKIL